jgi:hypothetical protein
VLRPRDLTDIADGMHIAALTMEARAREEGAQSFQFEYLVARAARFRRLRARVLRDAR